MENLYKNSGFWYLFENQKNWPHRASIWQATISEDDVPLSLPHSPPPPHVCLAAVQTLSSLIWGLLNLKYKDISIILLKDGWEGSGRTGQPQLGSPGRTDNKEIWERFQGRKVCITGGSWKKRWLKSRRDLKVSTSDGESSLHQRGRMEGETQELSVG